MDMRRIALEEKLFKSDEETRVDATEVRSAEIEAQKALAAAFMACVKRFSK